MACKLKVFKSNNYRLLSIYFFLLSISGRFEIFSKKCLKTVVIE